MNKTWKEKFKEFLCGEGEFAAKDLSDFGLTPYGDDAKQRQLEIRHLEEDVRDLIERSQYYWDRFSSSNNTDQRSSDDQ